MTILGPSGSIFSKYVFGHWDTDRASSGDAILFTLNRIADILFVEFRNVEKVTNVLAKRI